MLVPPREKKDSEVQSSSKGEIKRGQMESLHLWWVPELRPGTPHSDLTVYLCTPTALLKAAKLAPSKPRYFQSNRTELTAANKHEEFQHDWFVWTYKQLRQLSELEWASHPRLQRTKVDVSFLVPG